MLVGDEDGTRDDVLDWPPVLSIVGDPLGSLGDLDGVLSVGVVVTSGTVLGVSPSLVLGGELGATAGLVDGSTSDSGEEEGLAGDLDEGSSRGPVVGRSPSRLVF